MASMQSILQRDNPECNVSSVISSVPLGTLSESETQEYSPQLRQLLSYVRPFRKQDLWTEVAIWERIYYKNVNQHRQSRCFKKFVEVRKLFKRLKEVNPSSFVTKLYTSFYEGDSMTKSTVSITSLPTREYVNYNLHRTISAALLLDRIQVLCMETYRSHQHLLKKKFFVPLTLVIMSLCCRVYSCCKQWSAEIEDFYDFMIDWRDKFTSKPETALINYNIDKERLRHARRVASEEFYLRRVSDYQPVHFESGKISIDIHQVKAEPSLRETIAQISKHSGIDVMDEDYGEILSRGDEQGPSISKEFTAEQEIVAIVENQTLETAKKAEKKRKASDDIGTDVVRVQKTAKSIISKVDIVKPAKKNKATVEARNNRDGGIGSPSSAVQESKVKYSNVNSNVDTKQKTKSKTKGTQAKQSKENSKDEIDDIFGF